MARADWCNKCDASLLSEKHQQHLNKKRQFYQNRKKRGQCQNCEKPLAPRSRQFCQDHLDRRNSKTKVYRENRRGKCVITSCSNSLAVNSVQFCEPHLRHNQILTERRRATKISNNQCIVGKCSAAPTADNLVCEKHNKRQAQNDNARRKDRISNGVCQTCGLEPLASKKIGINCLLKSVARANLPSADHAKELAAKLRLQNDRCNACGIYIQVGQNAELGHLSAVSRSGLPRESLKKITTIEDVQWLCRECNAWQSMFSWKELMQVLPIIYDLNIESFNDSDAFAQQAIKMCHHLKLREPPSQPPSSLGNQSGSSN